MYVCLLLILSNKLDLNQETRFTILKDKLFFCFFERKIQNISFFLSIHLKVNKNTQTGNKLLLRQEKNWRFLKRSSLLLLFTDVQLDHPGWSKIFELKDRTIVTVFAEIKRKVLILSKIVNIANTFMKKRIESWINPSKSKFTLIPGKYSYIVNDVDTTKSSS